MRPGLLEAPIPTRWLLGGAPPLGRGVAPRLQEMVGEGQESVGMRAGVPGGGLLGVGGGGQDCHQGELGAPQPIPTAHAAESRAQGRQSPGRAETTSRPSGQGGDHQAARAARLLGGGRAPDGRGSRLQRSELCPRGPKSVPRPLGSSELCPGALSPVPALWLASPLSVAGARPLAPSRPASLQIPRHQVVNYSAPASRPLCQCLVKSGR